MRLFKAMIDRDGTPIAMAVFRLNDDESTSINLSIDQVCVAGVEFTDEGPAFIGWFPPNTDDWIELAQLPLGQLDQDQQSGTHVPVQGD